MKIEITCITPVLQAILDFFPDIISFQHVFHLGVGRSQIEWKLKAKTRISVFPWAKIGQNDHSNPYIESTTVLSDYRIAGIFRGGGQNVRENRNLGYFVEIFSWFRGINHTPIHTTRRFVSKYFVVRFSTTKNTKILPHENITPRKLHAIGYIDGREWWTWSRDTRPKLIERPLPMGKMHRIVAVVFSRHL